jgi:hypothetical protein
MNDAPPIPDEFADATPACWTDMIAIRQLFHVYAHRIDQGTPSDISRLFARNGELVLAFSPARNRIIGRDAIRDWFADYMRATRAESRHNRHSIGGMWALVGDHTAYSRTWWDASGIRRDTGAMHVLRGFYRDWLACDGGGWFLGRREIHIWESRLQDGTRVLRPEPTIPRLRMAAWSYREASEVYFNFN